MSLLVLQIVIRQWDKGQLSEAEVAARERLPDRYPVSIPPAILAFDGECVIDIHGDERQQGRGQYARAADGKIRFDRIQIQPEGRVLAYSASMDAKARTAVIGSLEGQWIQCKYHWRYGIIETGQHYWLYEDVTLNAIYAGQLAADVFLHGEPAIVHRDPEVLNVPLKRRLLPGTGKNLS